RPSVDFPQPDSPTTPSVSPGISVKLTPSTALSTTSRHISAPVLTRKCTLRSRTSMSGAAVMRPDPSGRQGSLPGPYPPPLAGRAIAYSAALFCSPPPSGERSAEGVEEWSYTVPRGTTPHSDPPPQGGREKRPRLSCAIALRLRGRVGRGQALEVAGLTPAR